jgi:hypothetical protein
MDRVLLVYNYGSVVFTGNEKFCRLAFDDHVHLVGSPTPHLGNRLIAMFWWDKDGEIVATLPEALQ